MVLFSAPVLCRFRRACYSLRNLVKCTLGSVGQGGARETSFLLSNELPGDGGSDKNVGLWTLWTFGKAVLIAFGTQHSC